ncbi:hypothetical protein ACHAXT_013277 [Thalassiosira profunda]
MDVPRGPLADDGKETYVPYTRDVLPFLRALSGLSGEEEGEEGLGGGDAGGDDLLEQLDGMGDGIISELLGEVPQDGSGGGGLQLKRSFGKTKHAFALMDGRPMNAVFGDPCPGTTKLLRVEYLFQDFTFVADEANSPGRERKIRQIHCTTSRVFKSTFREHERVVLKRQDPLLRLLTDALGEDQQEDMHEDQQRDMLGDMKPADGLCEHETAESRMHRGCQLDDEAGIAISELEKLQVLNTKDNYKWTNRSVDLITRNCKQLFQASLWGIIRLNGICFEEADAAAADAPMGGEANENASMPRPMSLTSLPAPPLRLILLNLWGCHGLTDDAATQMSSLSNLRSLCVSECHKLTDRFVQGITQSLPQLVYLRLRYVRRITDASLESIGHQMTGFVFAGWLCQLMAERCTSLAELRLYSCRQLNVEGGNSSGVVGGRQFVQALRNVREVGNLSFLDLRECQIHEPFVRDDVFLAGMAELGFDETLRGLFVRPARWNSDVRRQLRLQLRDAEV